MTTLKPLTPSNCIWNWLILFLLQIHSWGFLQNVCQGCHISESYWQTIFLLVLNYHLGTKTPTNVIIFFGDNSWELSHPRLVVLYKTLSNCYLQTLFYCHSSALKVTLLFLIPLWLPNVHVLVIYFFLTFNCMYNC